MRIGHFDYNGRTFIGVIFADNVFDLSYVSENMEKDPLGDLTAVFTQGRFDNRLFHHLYMLGQYREEHYYPLGLVEYVPLYKPGKIICLGLNYDEHAAETDRVAPEEPIYFLKASSSVIAHQQPIQYPDDLGRIDPEAELAVIIGKTASKVAKEDAYAFIAGYTILNDVTARDLQTTDREKKYPWFRSKSIDTFCPIGPWIVTANDISPTEPLAIQLRVNNEIRQNSSTGLLIHNIPTLIETISSLITLEPGDIISTGTPGGIAPVYPGDEVEIEIEKIGILKNTVHGKKPPQEWPPG
jgi:5-oxopent-3-ene-1,2,5-tricarboxylate decarboxylase/2-hydroxyhepta-2,4-diene-1,7-dioate isomerase